MIEWSKRRVSRARLNQLMTLVDEFVPDERSARAMKKRILEILYLPKKHATSDEESVVGDFSRFKICG